MKEFLSERVLELLRKDGALYRYEQVRDRLIPQPLLLDVIVALWELHDLGLVSTVKRSKKDHRYWKARRH